MSWHSLFYGPITNQIFQNDDYINNQDFVIPSADIVNKGQVDVNEKVKAKAREVYSTLPCKQNERAPGLNQVSIFQSSIQQKIFYRTNSTSQDIGCLVEFGKAIARYHNYNEIADRECLIEPEEINIGDKELVYPQKISPSLANAFGKSGYVVRNEPDQTVIGWGPTSRV